MDKKYILFGLILMILFIVGCQPLTVYTNNPPEVKTVSGSVSVDATPSMSLYGNSCGNSIYEKSGSNTLEVVLTNPKPIGMATISSGSVGGSSCYGADQNCCLMSYTYRCIDNLNKAIDINSNQLTNLPDNCYKFLVTTTIKCVPEEGHGVTKQLCTSGYSVTIAPKTYNLKVTNIPNDQRSIKTTNVIVG